MMATGNAPEASWTGLIRNGLQRAVELRRCPADAADRQKKQIDSQDLDELIAVATFVTQKLGGPQDGEFRSWLRDSVGQLAPKYPAIIKAILQTNCAILTTNYDSLIEKVSQRSAITWKNADRCECVVRGKESSIIHIHGHWESADSVILGLESYGSIRNDEPTQTFLHAARLMKTFVYVGCGDGLRDPNFSRFFEWCEKLFSGSQYRHYRLALDSEVDTLQKLHSSGQRVQVIPYGADYPKLIPFLKSLGSSTTVTIGEMPERGSAPSGFKASAELASRVDEILTELANQPLVGRAGNIVKLEEFLERPSGFMLVTGDAGYGKSALIAHWLRGRPAQPKAMRHLFSLRSDLTRSVLEFYRSTLVTLSVHWNQPLHGLPSSEGEARDALFALLEEVRTSGIGRDSPLLLVVDGLDEAAPAERWDHPFFPKILPEGMHIVVSVRLGDAEQVPAYLTEWIAQSDERLPMDLLDPPALVEWMAGLGGVIAELAEDESAVNALLQKTKGLPLHLAFIFDDLARLPSRRENFAKLIEQTPTGFSSYVDLQFRRLVESPAGREQRWREFFGLLIAAKAELQCEDVNAILGLTVWDLFSLPRELHRWVSQRGDGYAFRNEALRSAFARLDPWPAARERLLEYSRDWQRHKRPYALRSLIGHLRDAHDRTSWFATATDPEFLRCQGDAFPYEPIMPLQTIEEAMAESIAREDLQSLCHLIFVHARWMPDPSKIDPLKFAISAPAMAWQQIKLAEMTDPSTETIWQLLVAWRCAVEGRTEEARRFLSQVAASTGRRVHAVYWMQILGVILPKLMEIDSGQTLHVALALIDTAELPHFLGATLPPAEAIALTQKWYEAGKREHRTGWLVLWRSMAEKGELSAIFDATRKQNPKERARALWEVSLTLAKLGRLDQLHECLSEIEKNPGVRVGSPDFMDKTRAVILASIGSLRVKSDVEDGRRFILQAEAIVNAMPPVLPTKAETMARVAVAWAYAGAEDEAARTFQEMINLIRAPMVRIWLQAGVLPELALWFWEAHRTLPSLRHCGLNLISFMEELSCHQLTEESGTNLRRSIAEGWFELGDPDRAWMWLGRIGNSQVSGKALGSVVERRLAVDDAQALRDVEKLLSRHDAWRPGWGLVRLGTYHVRRKEWNEAADAFSRAVQSGATHGGQIDSVQLPELLGELAHVFDVADNPSLAVKHIDAAIWRAKKGRGHWVWWSLLNVANRTFGLRSTDLGVKALEEATAAAFLDMNDPYRIPLLCFVARVQHLVACQPERAQEALRRAMHIIRNHVHDRVKGTALRCEIVETLHLCGLDDEAHEKLQSIASFAESRITIPQEKANEVIAEAALGHARVEELKGAKRLLELISDHVFDAATRARAIIYTYEEDDEASEAEVCRLRSENYRARTRRDLACILIRLGRVEQALAVARRIQADRDNALPRIAACLAEGGHRDAFFKLIIPATRFPNATGGMLASLLRLHPELAPEVSNQLSRFAPDVFPSARA